MPIQLRAERPETFGPSEEWAKAYVFTVVGILKISEMVFSLIAFLCGIAPGIYYSGNGWFGFATISSFVESAIWFMLHLLNVIPRNVANQFIEAVCYALFSLFLFTAAIIVSVAAGLYHRYTEGHTFGAAAFFSFLCTLLWITDTVLQFLKLREGGWGRKQSPPHYSGGEQPQTFTDDHESAADSSNQRFIRHN